MAANRGSAQGSMTWEKSFEIPPKPGLQFVRNLILLSVVVFFWGHAPSQALEEKKVAMKGGKAKADTRNTDSRLKSKGSATGKRQSKKAAKDPNKPKRPASAFFVFMEEFRKEYAKEYPNNKAVSAVGKAGGEKWKSMSEAEKAPYVAKAEKRKTEYNKTMVAYNKKLAEGGNRADEESDKSKSEVNDEEEEEESGEEEDENDDE